MATTPKKTADKPEKADKAERAVPDDQKLAPVDIPAGEPYPTGKGRDPEADFEAAHGYRRSKE